MVIFSKLGDASAIMDDVIDALTTIMTTDDVIIVWLDDTSDVMSATAVFDDVIMEVDGWMVIGVISTKQIQEKWKMFMYHHFIVIN